LLDCICICFCFCFGSTLSSSFPFTAGYNGEFEGFSAVLQARNDEYGLRPDGTEYVETTFIHPYRMYVGVKGQMEDGSPAPADDFLARNGLRYGQVYGFAIDMSESGPSHGLWRDAFHRNASYAQNGALVEGMWIAQNWTWDGVVKNFQHDGSWDWQIEIPGIEGTEWENYKWWNGKGFDDRGCKTEHLTPVSNRIHRELLRETSSINGTTHLSFRLQDPRPGKTGYIQGSTCGYFGHHYIDDVADTLAATGGIPAMFSGRYYVYQGELDITAQVELGGQGQYSEGRNATRNFGRFSPSVGKKTFDNNDGIEVFLAADGNLYAMIQEDATSSLGDRMFITSALEHEDDGKDLTYYFIAFSGGKSNTRNKAKVGIPAGTNCGAAAHEFSGLFDLSGLLRMVNGTFALAAGEEGYKKRANDAKVAINDKMILVGLQAHNNDCGIIAAFQSNEGGQWLVYQPDIPV
jgi:hypothetical protein